MPTGCREAAQASAQESVITRDSKRKFGGNVAEGPLSRVFGAGNDTEITRVEEVYASGYAETKHAEEEGGQIAGHQAAAPWYDLETRRHGRKIPV
jgi:hypothetical protein